MTNNDIVFFTNEYYRLLLILCNEERCFNGKRYTPLLYEELAITMNCSRQTIGKMIQILNKNGYVVRLMKGRLQVTSKGRNVIKNMECED